MQELETTFQSKIFAVESLSQVIEFSTNPEETIQFFEKLVVDEAISEIKSIVEDSKSVLANLPNNEKSASSYVFRSQSKECKIKNIMDDVFENILEMGLYGGLWAVLLHIIQLVSIKKYSDDRVSIFDLKIHKKFELTFTLISEFEKRLRFCHNPSNDNSKNN